MTVDVEQIRRRLREFDFVRLLVDELGWNHCSEKPLAIPLEGTSHALNAVSEKCGLVVYSCSPDSDGEVPLYPIRRKIERQVAKSHFEHMIIFTDAAKTTQVWQWVKRQTGKPAACREHVFRANQTGEALVQKLQGIAFELEEEEDLRIVEVAAKVQKALDVEKVTKKFYDRFKKEHETFLGFIKGIRDQADREWYASLMLNRMMFVYFIQKRGFLDGDPEYLRNRLQMIQARGGRDRFLRFYRLFLLRLFHEGLGQPEARRSPDLAALLGKVPYLNGGLFDVHELERDNPDIQIPDEAFGRIFDFFDAYTWHLDERPLRADNEINPDVLGYIFEKYVNQKQMGAYYTKEDITGYISRNTVIRFLFEAARKECPVAFTPDGGVWRLLKDDPDRYFYPAVRKGMDLDLPKDIAAGLNDVSEREGWNRPAPAEYALPTETWREHVARRKRYQEVRAKLVVGEITSIDDLITYNLDICKFAEDVIVQSEGPELVKAFWHAIEKLSVLDPTCGSGAFLFAALNVLEPLYTACLEGMQGFLDDLERSGRKHHPDKLKPFRDVLDQVARHPNRRYFILKSIVVGNLYGVDIMEEAVEICKLRLFLKLVAQVGNVDQIEPLPDIDFNIRAGNTLVGFKSMDALRNAMTMGASGQQRMLSAEEKQTLTCLEEDAELADRAFQMFRRMQTEHGMDADKFGEAKAELRRRLDTLRAELDRYVAAEYGVRTESSGAVEKWQATHRPFHWFIEFYGIMRRGGFDVTLGNPPYLEVREVDYRPRNFRCGDSDAIHAMCVERSVDLLQPNGCVSMIVPLSLVSTQRMQILQQILEQGRNCWYANFSWRPGKLFETVNRALTIFVASRSKKNGSTFSSAYRKWNSDSRDLLIPGLMYVECPRERGVFWVPKLGDEIERTILQKCMKIRTTLSSWLATTNHRVYYRTTGGLYWKVFTDFAPAFKVNGMAGHSSRETWFSLRGAEFVKPIVAALSSDVFWWWYTVTTNLRDLNPYDLRNFPIPDSVVTDPQMSALGVKYLADLKRNSTMLLRVQKQTGRTETQSFKIQKSKAIIDEVDRALAKHYSFSAEELDFIINYDIKYRLGQEEDEGAEE